MADNYLENKMEEHRRGGPARHYRPQITPTGNRPGVLTIKFPPRRVFVTGGASGIGKAVVTAFMNAGCRVAFCDIDQKNGSLTAQATGARFYPADVADPEVLQACLKKVAADWGDVDIIVNNAGISDFKPLAECTVADFDNILNVNLRPVFITAKFMQSIRMSQPAPNPYGRIINIASTRAFMSEAGTEAYSASKGGIVALTHALMMSLAPLGITVNSIAPGWIETGDYEALPPAEHEQHPSRRVGRPDDIAQLCIWLAMEQNNFVNGENIVVDGGMTRKMQYI